MQNDNWESATVDRPAGFDPGPAPGTPAAPPAPAASAPPAPPVAPTPATPAPEVERNTVESPAGSAPAAAPEPEAESEAAAEPAAAAALTLDDLSEERADADDDVGRPDDPGLRARWDDQAAKRRKAETEARAASERAKELEKQLEESRKKEIDEDSVRDYERLKYERDAVRYYAQKHAEASAAARQRGEDPPPLDLEPWLDAQLQTWDAQHQKPVTAADVAQTVEQTIRRVRDEDRAAFEKTASARADRDFAQGVVKAFNEDANLSRLPTPQQKALARDVIAQWRKGGRKATVADTVKKLTAAQTKAASVATSARAERARSAVPLSTGAGVPAPSTKSKEQQLLDEIKTKGLDVAQTRRLIQSRRVGQ